MGLGRGASSKAAREVVLLPRLPPGVLKDGRVEARLTAPPATSRSVEFKPFKGCSSGLPKRALLLLLLPPLGRGRANECVGWTSKDSLSDGPDMELTGDRLPRKKDDIFNEKTHGKG